MPRLRSDPNWRDAAASGLAAGEVQRLPPRLTTLVLQDPRPDLAAALSRIDSSVTQWSRRRDMASPDVPAAGTLRVPEVSPWPPLGSFDLVGLRLPKAKDELEMWLHAAAARLSEGGRVWIYGAKDEGAGAVAAVAEGVFERTETIATGGRCRLIEATVPRPNARGERPSWRSTFDPGVEGLPRWISYPGCFAHGRLDAGSGVLMDRLPEIGIAAGMRILDFGAGTGLLAGAILGLERSAVLTLVDNDALSLAAAHENLPDVDCILAHNLDALPGDSFDLIVSNPPYHRGKASDLEVVERLCSDAGRVLTSAGRLVMVVERTIAVRRLLADRFASAGVLSETGGYRIWQASTPL